MFPIEDGRRRKFNVLRGDVAELRADAEWAARCRRAPRPAARAHAEAAAGRGRAPRGQAWTHWDVRLAKIVPPGSSSAEPMPHAARATGPRTAFPLGSVVPDELLYMLRRRRRGADHRGFAEAIAEDVRGAAAFATFAGAQAGPR